MKNTKHRILNKSLIMTLVLLIVLASVGFAFAETAGDSSSEPPEPPAGSQDGSGNPPEPPGGFDGEEPPGGFGGGPGQPPEGQPGEMPEGVPPMNPGENPPPDFGDRFADGPGGPMLSGANIEYSGATVFETDTTEDGQTYTSTESDEQALLVTGGDSVITNATVTKTGDSEGDESDFYGTNAGVLVNSGSLEIQGTEIETDGAHANAVFAIGEGEIVISDPTIHTSSNNSGAIMVTGGGTLTANNVKAVTEGNSSAPIRSDRGGGTMVINGGTYESHGVGSPVVYSTADITVNDAEMIATASEGVVVEGKNSVTLNGVTMTADNNTHNGHSETYKAVMLYQSMSGDAEQGTASFSAKDSSIEVLNGDTIFVTNTTAQIYLENNYIVNSSGDFLRIQAGAWGNSGSNGGHVTAVLSNQEVAGNIIVDGVSDLALTLKDGSTLAGAIDTEDQAGNVSLAMSADSKLLLTGDTYVDVLVNEDSSNSNIYLNGYKLYVAGVETAANDSEITGGALPNNTPLVVGGLVLAGVVAAAIAASRKRKAPELVPEAEGADAVTETVVETPAVDVEVPAETPAEEPAAPPEQPKRATQRIKIR